VLWLDLVFGHCDYIDIMLAHDQADNSLLFLDRVHSFAGDFQIP